MGQNMMREMNGEDLFVLLQRYRSIDGVSIPLSGIGSWSELHCIGSNNIQSLYRYVLTSWEVCKERYEEALGDCCLLLGDTPQDLARRAELYEFPEEIVFGKEPQDNHSVIEPIDEASVQRRKGTTTFNVCGWCVYANRGYTIHHCNLNPVCRLLPSENGVKSGKKRFDTPCELLKCSSTELRQVGSALLRMVQKLEGEVAFLQEVMRRLRTLEACQRPKPFLPAYRDGSCFLPGEEIVFFLPPESGACVESCWYTGIVGARTHPVIVEFLSGRTMWERSSWREGRHVICSMNQPYLLPLSSLRYLQQVASFKDMHDRMFYQIWIRSVVISQGKWGLGALDQLICEAVPVEGSGEIESIMPSTNIPDALHDLRLSRLPDSLEELDEWYASMKSCVSADKYPEISPRGVEVLQLESAVMDTAYEMVKREIR